MPTGPSSSQSPYLVSTAPGVTFTSIVTSGDSLPGTTNLFAGIPDGIGAFDNGNGTITVLLNHEIAAGNGAVRAHGSNGAFVEKLVIDINSLRVNSSSDLVTSGSNIFQDNDGDGTYVTGTTVWNRFCSGDLPAVSAYFDAASGLGTTNRIYMAGEESGSEGRAFAFIVTGTDAGKAFELPRLGNMAFENQVANHGSGSKTVVAVTDDTSPLGQVYVYVGDKQATGNDVQKAGLTNGKFYGIKVSGVVDETTATTIAAAGASFSLVEIADAATKTGAQIQIDSEAAGITEFLRPEDAHWDPVNPNRLYFVTTDAITAPSRLWAADFNDAKNPTAGGTIKMLLDGTEGQVMMDNITVGADGHVYIQEDPGNNARLAKLWDYNPLTDTLTQIAEHDSTKFGGINPAFNQDEESSGVYDVTSLFNQQNKWVYLLDTQAHFAVAGEVVEKGQLQLMVIDRTVNGTSGNDTFTGTAEAESY
jgi:serralysin